MMKHVAYWRTMKNGWVFILFVALPLFAGNWPQWRGPTGNGVAEEGDYPVIFSPTTGVVWRAELPGRGSSTPVVWDNQIVLTCGIGAEDDALDSAVCLDWKSGKTVWQVSFGKQRKGRHRRGGGSCPSPVTDGERYFVYYKSGTLAALDFEGQILWQINLQARYGQDKLLWDLGTSPVLADHRLVVAVMQDVNSYLVAFDPASGKELWHVPRPFEVAVESGDSYTTPLVTQQEGRTVLVLWGAGHLSGHDAADGRMLWSCAGFNLEHKPRWRDIASPALEGELAIIPYGREQFVAGVRMGGAGDITASGRLWEKRGIGSDSATPAVANGLAYVVSVKGDLSCLSLQSGQEQWCARVAGKGACYSSPIWAGGHLYLCRDTGDVCVGRVSEGAWQPVHQTVFDDHFVASPVAVRGHLLLRGERALWCIGPTPKKGAP